MSELTEAYTSILVFPPKQIFELIQVNNLIIDDFFNISIISILISIISIIKKIIIDKII